MCAKPSEAVISAAEDVLILHKGVEAGVCVEQKEEGLDWFRQHEEREKAHRAWIELD